MIRRQRSFLRPRTKSSKMSNNLRTGKKHRFKGSNIERLSRNSNLNMIRIYMYVICRRPEMAGYVIFSRNKKKEGATKKKLLTWKVSDKIYCFLTATITFKHKRFTCQEATVRNLSKKQTKY